MDAGMLLQIGAPERLCEPAAGDCVLTFPPEVTTIETRHRRCVTAIFGRFPKGLRFGEGVGSSQSVIVSWKKAAWCSSP